LREQRAAGGAPRTSHQVLRCHRARAQGQAPRERATPLSSALRSECCVSAVPRGKMQRLRSFNQFRLWRCSGIAQARARRKAAFRKGLCLEKRLNSTRHTRGRAAHMDRPGKC